MSKRALKRVALVVLDLIGLALVPFFIAYVFVCFATAKIKDELRAPARQ